MLQGCSQVLGRQVQGLFRTSNLEFRQMMQGVVPNVCALFGWHAP